ncbi:FAD-dependent oxidoreductase [Nocardia nova]|uniref:FAD-dependent oxidoreductase n=1 Tax=Nocardia nova TaxID=37330 RepID=UPI0033CE890A
MGKRPAGRDSADVVIVGAGPAGLSAAVRLAERGVTPVVVDMSSSPTQTSNAALVHASTLELLAELGVGDDLVSAGRKLRRIVMADRGQVLARIDLTGIASRYPFALGVPQSTTEEILLRRFAGLGGVVRRNHRVESLRTTADGYRLTGTNAENSSAFELHARYVIGADGAHSVVRAAIGVQFRGDTYPSQFVLADVALSQPPCADDEAAINLSPHGVTVIGQLPGGNYRVIATVDADATVPRAPGRSFVDALLTERDIHSHTASEAAWSSRFRVHHRVADRFRDGDVFLVGDAAHVHSPAAGQGMNTGIADAYDVATRLAAVVTGRAEVSVLDGYEQSRRPAAKEVVRFTDRMTRMAMLSNPIARRIRGVVLPTATRIGPIHNTITTWVTGLGRSPLRTELPSLTGSN